MKKIYILVVLFQLISNFRSNAQTPAYCFTFIANCKPSLEAYIDNVLTKNKCKQWTSSDCKNTDSKSLSILHNDKVIIGANEAAGCGDYSLYVQEGIQSKSLKIGNESFCDYVFEENYPLKSLSSVQEFINENKRLPGFKSSKEIDKEGSIELSDIKLKQQEKIEEAFLYLIQLQKETDQLEKQYAALLEENKKLKGR